MPESDAVDLTGMIPDLSSHSYAYSDAVNQQVASKNNGSMARNEARSQYQADYGNYLTSSADWNIQNLDYQTYQFREKQRIEQAPLRAAQQARFDRGNASAAASFDALRPTGFNGTFTDAEWQATINNKVQQWAAPVYETIGYVADAALLLTGVGTVALGAKLAAHGAKGVLRGTLISGYGARTLGVGALNVYGGYEVADTGLSIASRGLYGNGSESISNFVQGGFDAYDIGQHLVRESTRNGGFVLASGLTVSGDAGVGGAVTPIGLWLSADFETMSFNGGLYGSEELSSKLGMPIPSLSVGVETTVFTSPDFKGALTGKYTLQGISSNYKGKAFEFSQIQADSSNINGYQFTRELVGSSVISPKHNPVGFAHYGYGDIYWRYK